MQYAEEAAENVGATCLWSVLLLSFAMGLTAALSLQFMPRNTEAKELSKQDWMLDHASQDTLFTP
jgi:hypothetical protein